MLIGKKLQSCFHCPHSIYQEVALTAADSFLRACFADRCQLKKGSKKNKQQSIKTNLFYLMAHTGILEFQI